MANSKYEYVRSFEQSAVSLQNTYIVVRIDGRGFHKWVDIASSCKVPPHMTPLPCRFSVQHGFEKPNDRRALDLMNAAATAVVKELAEICCAYGASDEFRYGIRKFHDTLYVLIVQFCLRSIHYIVWSKREVSLLPAIYMWKMNDCLPLLQRQARF